jgi:hypothetical protein
MNTHDPHTNLLDVDEAWIAEWAADGLAAIEHYLAKHAAFAEYLATRAVVHSDDGDRRPDA